MFLAQPHRAHCAAIFILLVALAVVYWRVAGFGYSGIDDQGYVIYTEMVRSGLSLEGVRWAFTEFHMSNWHPLTWLSHMLDVTLFGIEPGPQHVVNVAIHGLNSVLVYCLALAMLRNWSAALVVALLFLVHPLHVESVAWIAERKDVLCGFFFLLALLAYLRYANRPGIRAYLWVVTAFILALLSKPMAVTLPIVFLLLDYWPLDRSGIRGGGAFDKTLSLWFRLVAEKIPLFLLSLASGLVTLAAQTKAMAPVDDLSIEYRLMNTAVAYAAYLRDTLVPTKLAVLYPLYPIDFFGAFVPSLLALGALSAAAIALRRKYPWLIVGWLWFLVTLLPVIGLIQVGSQARADRYMYLPSLGLFLAFGAVLARLGGAGMRKALFGLAPAMCFYTFLAWLQVGYWSGPYMLFSHVLDVVGESYQAHVSLATYFLGEGFVEQAEAHATRAVSLEPDMGVVHAGLAAVLMVKGDYVAAERSLRTALEKSPGDAQLMNNLGAALEQQGRLDEARYYYDAALRSDPDLYKVRNNLKRVGG